MQTERMNKQSVKRSIQVMRYVQMVMPVKVVDAEVRGTAGRGRVG